ncbi:MAG TPA: hypothetical protein VGR28_14550 [Candidatus Thermoplasmatota archaeon]|jgi:predicted transcriptional regulator|nr:hypothetical protein [Candidatus Thermoplasmatota archaeon]
MAEEALAFEARRRLMGLLERHPGVHLRELERLSALPLSTLRYHLEYLQRHGLVDAEQDRQFVRYFARRDLEPAERQTIAALRQAALRRVLMALLEAGGEASYGQLRASLAMPASTLSLHLGELLRRGLVARTQAGRASRYTVVHGERVIRLLLTYRSSFLDAFVDHLLAALYPEDLPRGGEPPSPEDG